MWPIKLWRALLYKCWTYGRLSSHVHGFLDLYMHRICTIILLTTFICPFVKGWKAFDLVNMVSIKDHRLHQKVLKNLLSLSKIMVLGNPKWYSFYMVPTTTVALVVILFLHGAKMAILENQSTNHKDTIMTMLGGGKTWHVIHRDWLPRLVWGRERSVQP